MLAQLLAYRSRSKSNESNSNKKSGLRVALFLWNSQFNKIGAKGALLENSTKKVSAANSYQLSWSKAPPRYGSNRRHFCELPL